MVIPHLLHYQNYRFAAVFALWYLRIRLRYWIATFDDKFQTTGILRNKPELKWWIYWDPTPNNFEDSNSDALGSDIKLRLFKLYFTTVWLCMNIFIFYRAFDDEKKAKMGVVECVKHDLMQPFNVLYERDGKFVKNIYKVQ